MIGQRFSDIFRKKVFFKSVSIYASANIIEKSIPFVLLPILTRLLSTFDYGVITTINAVRSAIDPALSMSTPAAVGRAYFDRDKPGFDFSSYAYNAVVVNGSLFLVVILGFGFVRNHVREITGVGTLWLLFVVFYVWAAATGGIKVKLWIYQQMPRHFGLYNVLKTFCNASLSVLLVAFLLRNWKGRILGIGLTELLFCIIALYFLWKVDRLHFRIDFGYIKDILKFGLPLLAHAAGMMAISTVDKFFLNAFVGISVTGVYGVGYALGSSLTILAVPIDQTAEPIIYSKLGKLDDNSAFQLVFYSYLYFVILVLMALGLWILAPLILRILVDEKFYGASEYVLWIALGYAAFCMRRLLVKYITYSRKTYLMTLVTVITGVVAVIANYFLIKANGSIGAAQATFVALATNFILTWLIAMKLYPMPWFSIFKLNMLRSIPGGLKVRD
jgi:O-antigen/teichoic acid export membrane protein